MSNYGFVTEEKKKEFNTKIVDNGNEYNIQIVGEMLPFTTIFDVRIGSFSPMFVEASSIEGTESYLWFCKDETHPLKHLAVKIGAVIEENFK